MISGLYSRYLTVSGQQGRQRVSLEGDNANPMVSAGQDR